MQPSGAFGAAVKSQCRLPASLINVHPPPLPIELPDGVHLKQQLYDGLRAWISVTHAGDLDWVLGFWVQLDPVLAVASIWGKWMRGQISLSHSISLHFKWSKNKDKLKWLQSLQADVLGLLVPADVVIFGWNLEFLLGRWGANCLWKSIVEAQHKAIGGLPRAPHAWLSSSPWKEHGPKGPGHQRDPGRQGDCSAVPPSPQPVLL